MATRSGEPKQASDGAKASPRQQPVDVSHVSRKKKSDVDDFDYNGIIEKAENTDNPDGYKYQVAVQMAKNKAGAEIDDADMRDLVDSEFAKLNPTATGAAMRGEDNIGAQLMGGFSEARDNLSDMVGTGIDTAWDTIAGGGAGLLGGLVGGIVGNDDLGQEWNDFVSSRIGDEDGAILDTRTLGDIATGIGIAAIPGIGVPLSAGLALADNADNIREAVEGRDSITRERLDDDERWTKAGSAALDTVLAALPGIGKLRNDTAMGALDDILANSDDIAKGISEASTLGRSLNPKNMATIAVDRLKAMPGRTANRAAKTASGVRDAVTNGKGVFDRAGKIAEAIREPSNRAISEGGMRNAIAQIRGGADPMGDLLSTTSKVADDGGTFKKALSAVKNYVAPEGMKSIGSNIVGAGGMVASGIGDGIVNYAAETNQNPYEAMDQFRDAITSNNGGDPWSALRSIGVPLGVNAILGANRLPGPSGRYGSLRSPLRFAQTSSGGELGERAGQASQVGAADADSLADWIEGFGRQDDKE